MWRKGVSIYINIYLPLYIFIHLFYSVLIMLFSCSSRHTMCTDCFIDMCRMKLVSNGFKNFDMLGYSLPCPGPGKEV